MKLANTALFRRLIEFSGRRGFQVPEPSAPRWVHANMDADEVLKGAVLRSSMSFGRFRHLAWVEAIGQHYIATIGFDSTINDPAFELLEDIQGFDVCLLSELQVAPTASASTVYNVVAAGDRDSDPNYIGHDNDAVINLFPSIQVFVAAGAIDDQIIWPTFLAISAEESRSGGSWIEDELANSLTRLAEANVELLPYNELCRSTLELDPRSLFMSLYRCIEGTYAYDQATKLKRELSIEREWYEIAELLENAMSWRPLEATSLRAAFAIAQENDLREICNCMSVTLTDDVNVEAAAAKAIYKLRNRIVHYRPALAVVDTKEIDWNRLCIVLVSVMQDVFRRAYGRSAE